MGCADCRSVRLLGMVEPLEDRITPSGPDLISNTEVSPYRRVVQIETVWDSDGNGRISDGDFFSQGSGAMIGRNAVLSAAHVLYSEDLGGWYDWAFVHPGRDGRYDRPYGEVQVVETTVPSQYVNGDNRYDIAVLELDRNIGDYTGWFGYGYLSGSEMTALAARGVAEGKLDQYLPFLPQNVRDGLADVYNVGVDVGTQIYDGLTGLLSLTSSDRIADVKVYHYPGEYDFSGEQMHVSYADEDDGPIFAYDAYTIYADMENLWTSGGSSGSPLVVTSPGSLGGLIIGVLSRGDRTEPGGSGIDQYTRIDDDYFNFIGSVISEMGNPNDRPELVSADAWNGVREGSSPTQLTYDEGESTPVSIGVRNVGTATAFNVKVRFALSKNARFGSDDILLGTGTIARIDPFTTETLNIDLTFPDGADDSGWRIVYKIDPSNAISEYGTELENYAYRDRFNRPNDTNFGLNYGQELNYRYTILNTITSGFGLTGNSYVSDPDDNDLFLYGQSIVRPQFSAISAEGSFEEQLRELRNSPFHPRAVLNRVGAEEFAVSSDSLGEVQLLNSDGSTRFTLTPFANSQPGVRVASADFNGDGVADLVVGTAPGQATRVQIFDGVTQAVLFSLDVFEASFLGGVFVAAGDLNGDGRADLAITPDQGGGPRVRIFSGDGFIQLADFFAIEDPNFFGGARAALGDINGDGVADLVVAAGFGGGPRVAAFSGRSIAGSSPEKLFPDFLAFEEGLRNGVYVAVGDLDGDGKSEVIAGGGPGGGPRVSAFAGADLLQSVVNRTVNFFAGDPENRGGVRLTVKNLDGDRLADLITGTGPTAAPNVRSFRGAALSTDTSGITMTLDAFAGANGIFVG
ncbi:FG-GAP-like repeat-containing protein [Tuwongella immobilis]|uniref:Serine protease n=1 Tax=Tuwongella immobilis TaxID=692036 RepID=A0A6C2YGR6_9BACT|nr:FG-GAP-like repeat-containing protein [Tuwongella immobilis]VIP00720.1 na-ca exchanger integrin-beta4 : Hemolysin-type calcium-binding region domain protein OS=Rhodopirellula maiorica SM1 GN=RMSM_03614 PE=4 SV=1: Trypsin: FG-GAP: VCBS [Tuwongella immobilis]VTR96858.1 na-ca exchanger integrin-beta4 : Hemolysin-type calcium-binding region domain protein OS=Rhodopirellula maiorica SM1 GN=RMSM_03614 PE=4 SV=1: Trypsin: FG-GAP: VCBS [Tuwongella immobilis]